MTNTNIQYPSMTLSYNEKGVLQLYYGAYAGAFPSAIIDNMNQKEFLALKALIDIEMNEKRSCETLNAAYKESRLLVEKQSISYVLNAFITSLNIDEERILEHNLLPVISRAYVSIDSSGKAIVAVGQSLQYGAGVSYDRKYFVHIISFVKFFYTKWGIIHINNNKKLHEVLELFFNQLAQHIGHKGRIYTNKPPSEYH